MSNYEIVAPKISVIIPVYNTEQYLEECINSVINQTFKNLEIICINDGSTDNSLNILEKYAQKDSRIKIINQENKGVAQARNSGISICTGKYVFFLDSDDWINVNSLELLFNEAENKNAVIVAGYAKLYKGKTYVLSNFDINKLKAQKSLSKFDNENIVSSFFLFIGGKMYRRDFLYKNNIKFNTSLKMGEDGVFNYECIYNYATFSIILEHVYNYRITREDSQTSNLNKKNKVSDYDAIKYVMNLECFKQSNEYYQILYINAIMKSQLDFFSYFNRSNVFRKKMNKIYKLINKNLSKSILLKCKYYADFKYIALYPVNIFHKLVNYNCWKNFINIHIVKKF